MTISANSWHADEVVVLQQPVELKQKWHRRTHVAQDHVLLKVLKNEKKEE